MGKNKESRSSFELDNDFNEDLIFLNPYSCIEIKERNLPHWQQGNAICFITFHLADSIPKEKAEELRKERESWKLNHKEPYTEEDLKEFYRLFSEKTENLLNNGHGSCLLADAANAQIVAAALLNFNHKRYILHEWVIMPNHVHVLVKPLGDNKLSDILHSWKSYTASEINKRSGRTGQLWMRESYDHIVRNQKSFERIKAYIKNNPFNAGIKVPQASSLKGNSTSSFQLEREETQAGRVRRRKQDACGTLGNPNYWLVKFAPFRNSWQDILKNDRFEIYSVRSAHARNNLQAMTCGDLVLFYHSQEEHCVMGVMKVIKEAHQDPTTDDVRWVSVTFEPIDSFEKPVSLEAVKAVKELSGTALVKQPRLAVMSLSKHEFELICAMAARSRSAAEIVTETNKVSQASSLRARGRKQDACGTL